MISTLTTSVTLPTNRRRLLYAGTLLALCAYYFNYGTAFDEGEMQEGGRLTLLMRLGGVLFIASALLPLRKIDWFTWAYVALYVAGSISLLFAAGLAGGFNDSFFFNTLLQLPVLIALVGTNWRVNYSSWLRFICLTLIVQTIVDILLWQTGSSLWLSMAFIGGAGNPSSFGMLCAVGLAFCLFYPSSISWRWVAALILAVGAIQTKALFSALAVMLLLIVWMVASWKRALASVVVCCIVILGSLVVFSSAVDDDETSFLEHKLSAAGALIGLIDYDVESSASVYQRLEMHQRTFKEIGISPQGLFLGHLESLPYWPMDSQLLTYLGSFGIFFLAAFLLLQIYWMTRAWRIRRYDNGFSFLCLILFLIIFSTNRILDYYPMAIVYFLIIGSISRISVDKR